MDLEEQRQKDQEAAQAAVANPFGAEAAADGSPTASGSAGSGTSAPVVSAPSASGVGSNRAEKYLPPLPTIEHTAMNKGRVRELVGAHRRLLRWRTSPGLGALCRNPSERAQCSSCKSLCTLVPLLTTVASTL